MATPPDDAYGRVTDPERYRALHGSADALVNALSDGFVAEVVDVLQASPGMGSQRWQVYRLVRATQVVPEGGGAPITIGWTGFPGLAVWFGNWTDERYPQCGCDACDEHVDDLRDLLARHVESVTSGAFTEALERSGWRSWAFLDSSGRSLDGRQRWPNAAPAASAWRPWIRR